MTHVPGWDTQLLGDIADIRPGRTPKALDRYLLNNPRSNRTVPFYKVGDMNAHPSDLRIARTYLAQEELASLGVSVLPIDSIVFPKAGGAIATNKKRRIAVAGAVDLNCMGVVPGDDVDARYLRAWFESLDLTSLADGSVLPQISKKTVSALSIPLPELAEQRRIVDILEDHLSRLDNGSALIRAATARIKAAEMASLMRLAEPLEDSRTLTLEQCAIGGLFCDGDWVESKDQDPIGTVRLTQLADVGVGVFRDRSNRWLRPDQAKLLGCTYLAPGDLLIARMPEPLARACRVPEDFGTGVTAVDVAIVRLVRPEIDPEWLMWAINSDGFRRRAVALQSGTTRKRISRKNLAALTLPVPSRSVQATRVRELEARFGGLRRVEEEAQVAKRRTDSLRRALLAAAFSGRLTGRSTDMEMFGEMAGV